MNLRAIVFLVGCGLLTALPSVHAKPSYISKIPNGSGVAGVTALGHKDPKSGGAINDFGKAFMSADHKWTKELCQADSDGDGQTNGEELGDPCCEWKEGDEPALTAGATDPGDASSKLAADDLKTHKALCSSGEEPTEKPTDAPTDAPTDGAATPEPSATVKPNDGAETDDSSTAPPAPSVTPSTDGSDEYEWVWVPKTGSATSGTGSEGNSAASPALPSSLVTASMVVAAGVMAVAVEL